MPRGCRRGHLVAHHYDAISQVLSPFGRDDNRTFWRGSEERVELLGDVLREVCGNGVGYDDLRPWFFRFVSQTDLGEKGQ